MTRLDTPPIDCSLAHPLKAGRDGTGRLRVLAVFGTRPEAIKMAPVVLALRAHESFEALSLASGQHLELLDQALRPFGVSPDHRLDVMRPGQSLAALTARLLMELHEHLVELEPDLVLVHGDTTTTFSAATAAFQAGIPVGHVEAGLRSGDLTAPFPEEANRRLVAPLASLHFAPTQGARQNLLAEGVPDSSIVVTGNTGIDALVHVATNETDEEDPVPFLDDASRVVLVTAHRRENQGAPLLCICRAVRQVVRARRDVEVVLPVHPNPAVRRVIIPELTGVDRVHLVEPLDYVPFVRLLKRSHLVLTDSGGVQEEAPSLGVPVLVLRETTERPEGVTAGCASVVGTEMSRMLSSVFRLLDDPAAHASMSEAANPYGDGRAAERIVAACLSAFGACGTVVTGQEEPSSALAS